MQPFANFGKRIRNGRLVDRYDTRPIKRSKLLREKANKRANSLLANYFFKSYDEVNLG